MAKLNQVIAVSKTVKRNAQVALTKAYHELPKQDPLSGIMRVYRPLDDDGEKLPPEHKKVQALAARTRDNVQHELARMFDTVGTIDLTNCEALADVIVDGQVLLTGVPATHLLWLEKQLGDLRTFVSSLPTLDPKYTWTWDENLGCYTTETVTTHRSKKVPRNHVKAAATEKHPAQVEIYYEDTVVGYWDTRLLSGAVPAAQVTILTERVDTLLKAVKTAREQANMTDAATLESSKLLDWLFRQN